MVALHLWLGVGGSGMAVAVFAVHWILNCDLFFGLIFNSCLRIWPV
jgi:hypothetical protein